MLPINVTACRKMLVLCGETYSTRLWCIWELFVLNAFSSQDTAAKKIEFRSPDLNDYDDALHSLRNFSMDQARCFDPNEEDKLRAIIHSRGREFFEARIHDLAANISVRAEVRRSRTRSRASSNPLQAIQMTGIRLSRSFSISAPSAGKADDELGESAV